jgi:acetylornithine deacetylase/succinyl-diaminopimelate desuccinylase-like protein
MINKAIEYAHSHQSDFINELKEFVRIPSISTDPECQENMVSAAKWLANQFILMGFDYVHIFPTQKHPIVFAEIKAKSQQAPTVLVYGHYDVQPPEPIELWDTPPFEPNRRGDNLFARGASDMKGQVVACLKAIEAILATGRLPVNIKFMVEGEEEIGSPNLNSFINNHKDLLACDFVLNPDAGMLNPDTPSIDYALRGLVYFELRVFGPKHDLHSGLFGGIIHNPAQALTELISGMHDSSGCVTLPGFYDKVILLSDEEKQELNGLGMDDDYFKSQAGVLEIWGEKGFSAVERVGTRPTLEIHGLSSGFTGKGSKTVIPAWAMAKLSCRLVEGQDPDDVNLQLRNYLDQNAPPTIRWELDYYGGSSACITARNTSGTKALQSALEKVWGKVPVFKREGGSIPVVSELKKILGVESVLTGFGLPDDNAHAPNEKLDLVTWSKGIDALIYFFFNLISQQNIGQN